MNYSRIKDNVFFVEGMNRGRYPYSNSLLIRDSRSMLIDTGSGPDITGELTSENIDIIAISHGHEDHIAGNNAFDRHVKICSHEYDAPAIRSVQKLTELYNVSGTGFEESMQRFIEEMFGLKDSRTDEVFRDGHVFDLGSLQVEVIHTPGHSAGHSCFYIPGLKIIFLGDIDLSSFGPWYGCTDSDIDDFIRSIRKLKTFDFETAVTSHKGVIHGKKQIDERLDLFIKKISERENRLTDFLSEEKTPGEIVNEAIIYGHFPDPREMYELMEKTMITKHLEKLLTENRIKETQEGYIAAASPSS